MGTTPTRAQIEAAARAAASRAGVDQALFLGLIQKESSFNPNARSEVDSKGRYAQGLTQLRAPAASDLGVDRYDWQQNLEGGARYLKQQIDRFGDAYKGVAAYFQGGGSVSKNGVSEAGDAYARKVFDLAKPFGKVGEIIGEVGNFAKDPLGKVGDAIGSAATGAASSAFGWTEDLFKRIVIGTLALLLIAAAIFLSRGNSITRIMGAMK